MVTIDGVLYHAVNINEMPENALVFAAPNAALTENNYFPKRKIRIPQNELERNKETNETTNLKKILNQFEKDRKQFNRCMMNFQ